MNPVLGPVMGPPTIGVFDFLGASVLPEAELWAGAVRANGGSVVNEDVAIVSAFIAAEIAAGAWALTDDYLGFWAPSAGQARVSIKQRRLATVTAAPTFTANRGYAFDGSTQFVDTGFVPSTHGVNCTGTAQRLGVYERTNISSSGVSAGTIDAATRALTLINRNGANASGRANHSGTNFALSVADSRGLKTVSRADGGLAVLGYDRGVRLTDGTAASVGTAAPTRAIYVGAVNNAGSAGSFRAASTGFVVVGGPLSDAQELAQYNNVQAWATIRGAQV